MRPCITKYLNVDDAWVCVDTFVPCFYWQFHRLCMAWKLDWASPGFQKTALCHWNTFTSLMAWVVSDFASTCHCLCLCPTSFHAAGTCMTLPSGFYCLPTSLFNSVSVLLASSSLCVTEASSVAHPTPTTGSTVSSSSCSASACSQLCSSAAVVI